MSSILLEHLPPEFFGILALYLNGYELASLAFLSGSRLLRQKCCSQSGVHTISYIHSECTRSCDRLDMEQWPAAISSFSSLFQLEVIRPLSQLGSLRHNHLLALPATLNSLTFRFHNAVQVWFFKPTQSPLDVLMHGSSSFEAINVSQVLPNLRHLELIGTSWDDWMPIGQLPSSVAKRFYLNLPRGITSLFMAPLARLTNKEALPLLPPHLQQLGLAHFDFLHPLPTSLRASLEEYRALSTLSRHAYSSHLPSESKDSITQLFFPSQLTTLDLDCLIDPKLLVHIPHTVQHLQIAGFQEHTIFPAWTSRLPPNLRRLRILNPFHTNEQDLSQLPHTLETLHIHMKTAVYTFLWSPRNLTSLSLFTKSFGRPLECNFSQLPPKLTNLSLGFPIIIKAAALDKLPKSLRTLSLASHRSFPVEDSLPYLPPSLTALELDGEYTASEKVFSMLPPSLTALKLFAIKGFEDSILLRLPKQLNHFVVPNITFFGESLPRDLTELDSDRLHKSVGKSLPVPLRHTIKLSLSLRDHDENAIDVKFHNPTAYPASIETLRWAESKPPLHQIFWMTPNLTQLNCDKNVKLDPSKRIPDTVTRLSWAGPGLDVSYLKHLTFASLPEQIHDIGRSSPPFSEQTLRVLHIGAINGILLSKCVVLEELWIFQPSHTSDSHLLMLPPSLKTLKVCRIDESVYDWAIAHRMLNMTGKHFKDLPASLTYYCNSGLKWDLSDIHQLPQSLTYLKTQKVRLQNMAEVCKRVEESGQEIPIYQTLAETLSRAYMSIIRPQMKYTVFETVRKSTYRSDPGFDIDSVKTTQWSLLPSRLAALVVQKRWPERDVSIEMRHLHTLPHGITYLDISHLPPLPHNSTNFLPLTLIGLRVNAKYYNAGSIAKLPRSITTLSLNPIGKWSSKYSVALPHSLTNLSLMCRTNHDKALQGLPSCIIDLELEAAGLTDKCLPFLPPGLTRLVIQSHHISRDKVASMFTNLWTFVAPNAYRHAAEREADNQEEADGDDDDDNRFPF